MAKSTKTNETTFSILPPSHLSKESAAWFRRTVALYFFDEHHIKLLTLACEAFDREIIDLVFLQEAGVDQVLRKRGDQIFLSSETPHLFRGRFWARFSCRHVRRCRLGCLLVVGCARSLIIATAH